MEVRFLNLSNSDTTLVDDILFSIKRILNHGQIIMGQEVIEFETKIDKKFATNSLGVSSGTDALYLALRALGVGKGDEVITSSLSFVATANAISLTGATPIFADVDDDFNISTKSIQNLITDRTKVILPVHYGGKICNMNEINKIANDNNLFVIEDASQAFGALYKNKFAGTLSDIGCISLNPMKILGAIGEAGLILTHNKEYLRILNSLRYNGLDENKQCQYIGVNAKIDTIQAAILSEKLKYVDVLIEKRRDIASKYNKEFVNFFKCPIELPDEKHVYFTYTIITNKRDKLKQFLESKGIEVKIYHTNIMDEPAYKDSQGECVNARRLSDMKLAIPCNENMTDLEINYVIESIIDFFNSN